MIWIYVAGAYFIGFLLSLIALNTLAEYVNIIESPYKDISDIIYGAIYFTFFFTLFDRLILTRYIKKHRK